MEKFHLGINMGHDRAVAVVQNGKIVVAIEQERLDRIKHSVGFMLQAPDAMGQIQVPGESIRYCLDTLGLPLDAMTTITANMPGADFAPQIMRGKFSADIAQKVCQVSSHHLAHAYSAFWPSGFDEAVVLVADASGSSILGADGRLTESYTLYEGRGTTLRELHSETVTSHLATLSTLGFIYESVSRKAGFVTQVKSGLSFPESGKLMGLAAYGGPQSNWNRWLSSGPGTWKVNISAYDIFIEMAALEKKYDDGQGKPHFRPWLVDLAYKVQVELEQVLTSLVLEACRITGLKKLCIAGGVGLNSVANYKIMVECGLDDIFIFPAAADNGIAVGCALWAYHHEEGGTERPVLGSGCLGRRYTPAEVGIAITNHEDLIEVERLDPESIVDRVAKVLAQGSIVARFEGGSEFGPRALGHRSILADPTFERMKDVVNARIKFRESFRPFAPFVPLERANEVFELAVPSPYMLLVAPVRAEYRATLPAITHEDGTGRIQTCTPEQDPFFHKICLAVEQQRGGPPVLLNTSFNVAGQPIVETPDEAIETFLRTDIDYLALDDLWIRRRHQPVKDYSTHVQNLAVESRPHGLPPGQPSVQALMEELDFALFSGGASSHWTRDELRSLAAIGARFKETSNLFPEIPGLVTPLETQLGAHATLILNPLGDSLLVDETGRQPDLVLDMDQIRVLLALRQDPETYAVPLRRQCKATPAEIEDRTAEMLFVMKRFDIPSHSGWQLSTSAISPRKPPSQMVRTLGAFKDPDFRMVDGLKDLRRRLIKHDYDETAICELLGIESLQSIEPTRLHYYDQYVLPITPLADLVRLFLIRAQVPRERVADSLSEHNVCCLEALGLLRTEGGVCQGEVDLFCSGGLLLVTDHRYTIRPEDHLDEDPVMYIGMDSHGLVQTAPRSHCRCLLDLCCGSGIQGLVGSRYADEIVAVDLNPRAVRFARFNAQLNGLVNYRAVLGNLYDAVPGERFDSILANPPFVPSPDHTLKYRDGGASGENVLQVIVEGARKHLSPDGRLCIVTDLVGASTYGTKLERWFGSSGGQGLILTTADRDEILFSVPHCHAPFAQSFNSYNANLDNWIVNFRSAKLDAVNFGYILVWNGPDGTGFEVSLRTIHNPSTPIWKQVEDWYEQRQLWNSDIAGSLILALHPDLHLIEEKHIDGTIHECLLRIPDNSFFTDYCISTELMNNLHKIHQTEPELSRAKKTNESGWVEEFHRLGVLRLVSTRRSSQVSYSTIDTARSHSIEQRATKTTPTCLSSYLG